MFDVAERMILAPSGLDENRLSTVLDAVMSRGVDYADLYFQLSREESWSLEDGIVKEGSHSIEQGSACAPSAARRPASPAPTRYCCRR